MNKETRKREADIAAELKIPAHHVCLVGSTLICGEGKDRDYLCLVQSDDALEAAGYEPDLDEVLYDSPLQSWRKGGDNLIAVTDRGFFLAEVAAAHAARVSAESTFDMREREYRVLFHRLIRQAVAHHGQADKDTWLEDILC